MTIRQPRPPAELDTIGYVRVSKQEQASESKTSLQDQKEGITALAVRLERELVASAVFEDRASGGDVHGRPGFKALVEFCRAHPRPKRSPGYALFLNHTRFGRFDDPDEHAYWRFELARHGWYVRFAENDESRDKTARHVMNSIGAAQATQYRDNLRENCRRGARGTAAQGYWQNEAPVGYRRLALAPGREPVVLDIGRPKAKDQKVRLTPDPGGEVRAVVEAFEVYADGLTSVGKLVPVMRRRVPRLKWSVASVNRMLRNVTYLGHVVWCRRPHDKHERAEQSVRPEAEWVVTRDAHPPLVTQELFARVEARLARNRKHTRATVGGYPLSGMIRCASCGEPYVGAGGPINYRDPSDRDRYRFYADRGSHPDRACCPGRTGTLQKRIIEPLVIAEVARVVADERVQALIGAEIDRYLKASREGSGDEITDLETAEKRLLAARENLVAAIARGTLTADEADAEMKAVRVDLEAAQAGLRRARALSATPADGELERDRILALAADFAARASCASGPALRELIAPWIEDAVFDKETRELVLLIRPIPNGGIAGMGAVRAERRVLQLAPLRPRNGQGRRGIPAG